MGQNVNMQADEYAGYHPFVDEDDEEYGSFEVFWHDEPESTLEAGWYWWACFPGCLPDGEEPWGPFDTSEEAYKDARGE